METKWSFSLKNDQGFKMFCSHPHLEHDEPFLPCHSRQNGGNQEMEAESVVLKSMRLQLF